MQYRARGRIHDMRSGASKTKAPMRSASGMRTGAKGSMTGVKHPKRAQKRQQVMNALGKSKAFGKKVRNAVGGGTSNVQPRTPNLGQVQGQMQGQQSRMTGNTMKPARPAPGVRRLGGGGRRGGRGGW